MAWTYNPVVTTRDQVRLLIGDTDTAKQQMQDEEINFFLTLNADDAYKAGAAAATTLAAKYSRLADTQIERIAVSYSQIAANYKELAKQIRLQIRNKASLVDPVMGGQSISEVRAARFESDRRPDLFTDDMDTNPPGGNDELRC